MGLGIIDSGTVGNWVTRQTVLVGALRTAVALPDPQVSISDRLEKCFYLADLVLPCPGPNVALDHGCPRDLSDPFSKVRMTLQM